MNKIRKLYKLSFKLNDGSIEKMSLSMLDNIALMQKAIEYLDHVDNIALASIVTKIIITEEVI
jgi:hypothetical protein